MHIKSAAFNEFPKYAKMQSMEKCLGVRLNAA